MRQRRGQSDQSSGVVDRGGLHRGDLVLAQALADDI
jgi:hypothetical protein